MRATGFDESGPTSVPRIGWRGVVLIFALWTFFGGAMSASLYLSGPSRGSVAAPAALVAFSLMGAYTWAALTLPLFHLAERLNLTGDQGTWRALRVGGLLVFGLVLSVSMSMAVALTSAGMLRGLLSDRLAGPAGLWVIVRYRVIYDLLACYLILTAGVARDYFLRYRSRLAEATLLRTQLAEARLQVLRAQLNPHFLFNTLNAVAALVQTDPRGVRRMIALLSDLLRETLDRSSGPEVPLERELQTLRRYLEIMEIRFRGRIETRVAAEPELMGALVPHLVLQPLVENAMKHGIGQASGFGRVEVTASHEGEDLVLTVRDTGRGASVDGRGTGVAEELDSHTHVEGGLGLRHTRERLDRLYGEQGRLELVSLDGGGTVAEVRLPYHRYHPEGRPGRHPAPPPCDALRPVAGRADR